MSITNDTRIIQESTACGVFWAGWDDGHPNLRAKTKDESKVASLVAKAHIGDDTAYASTDLETYGPAQELKALVTPGQWTAYVAIQTETKATLRNKEYEATNKEFFNVAYDLLKAGKTLTATNMAPWLTKVDEVKTKIPMKAVAK